MYKQTRCNQVDSRVGDTLVYVKLETLPLTII